MKAIAIDDEPMALEVIRQLAEKVPFIDLTDCFTNGFDAADHLRKGPVDLLFLDIRMPDVSGIDFLQSLPYPPLVIFTTAYSEHAVKGFELNAVDYILKPFSASRFLKACNRAFELFTSRVKEGQAEEGNSYKLSSIFIKSGNEQIRVNLWDIAWVESNGNYVQFVLTDARITCRLTITEVEKMLPAGFVRVHRSFIVARDRVQKFNKRSVWVEETEIPVGESYLDVIKAWAP